jgi:hypothetical protein
MLTIILLKIAFDQFHITQFCDSNGRVSYGCCLTITEHIDVPNDTILETLRGKILQETASNKIKTAYKHYRELKKRGIFKNRIPQLLSTPGKNESAPSKIMSMFSKSWSIRKAAPPTTGTSLSSSLLLSY